MMSFKRTVSAILLTLVLSTSAFASNVAFRVLGVKGQVLLQKSVATTGMSNVGQLSHDVLQKAIQTKNLSQYSGSNGGVNAINGLGGALEVLSDTKMNAYGWCYRVDGHASDLMADQFRITGRERVVEWFYAYAHLDRDVWKSMCVPADHFPPQE